MGGSPFKLIRMPRMNVKTAAVVCIVLTVAVTAMAASSAGSVFGQATSSAYSVNVATKPGMGQYLINATGFTLYTFKVDVQNSGQSKCVSKCIQAWPAFYVANLTLPPQLSASSFTVVTRTDGVKQLAYNGWPLYYFWNDTAPGDTNGQGVLQVWFVCTFPTPFADVGTAQAGTATETKATTAGGGW